MAVLLLRVGRRYTDKGLIVSVLAFRSAASNVGAAWFALGWARRDGLQMFYGWHSVDIDIERQHEGFEVHFFRYPL